MGLAPFSSHLAKFNQPPRTADIEPQKHIAHPLANRKLQRQLGPVSKHPSASCIAPGCRRRCGSAAVELAKQQGVYSVAQSLRLELNN